MSASYPGSEGPPPAPPTRPLKPHRGTTVLVLGILGFVICFICGIIAWVMGNNDLREMKRGRMDPEGQGLTAAGRICGIISTGLSIVWLSILVAILLPVFFTARGKAQEASCLSNEKQLALAMLMFAEDHNGQLPQADRWTDDILPYTKNINILRCPSDKSGEKSSYAMNIALSGKKLEEIANPFETVLIFDTSRPGLCPAGGPEMVASPPRHQGKNNFAFADGHIKSCEETPPFGPLQ